MTVQKKEGRYNLYKDGKLFSVKGGSGVTYLKELSECGGNTIMCWDTSKLASTLKEAAQYNIAVIIGLDIPAKDMDFYKDQKNVIALDSAYINIVNRYKNNPSVLAWCLGNELDFPVSLFSTSFYKAYNHILDHIHNVDPDHPVCTSVVNVPTIRSIIMIKWRIPSLDFYCLNIYNSIKTLPHLLDHISWIWKGPYLIGEWAPMGDWEAPVTAWQAVLENTSTEKAKRFYDFYTKYMPVNDPRFLGSIVFYWGSTNLGTKSWYSIFDESGSGTEVEEVLNDCWKDTTTIHTAPQINHFLIDGHSGEDNIILGSGSTNTISLVSSPSSLSDTLRYSWRIFSDWYGSEKPPAVNGLFNDSTRAEPTFKAPSKPGPYRVFVTIYNSTGHCATTNIPIYVIN